MKSDSMNNENCLLEEGSSDVVNVCDDNLMSPTTTRATTAILELPKAVVPDSFLTLNDKDVILSSAKSKRLDHPGNRCFQRLLEVNQDVFNENIERSAYIRLLVVSIVSAITTRGGRFMEKDDDNSWREVSHQKACVHAAMALRAQDTSSSPSKSSVAIKAVKRRRNREVTSRTPLSE